MGSPPARPHGARRRGLHDRHRLGEAAALVLRGRNVLIGCEGNEDILTYLTDRVGIEAFAWASDYPTKWTWSQRTT